MNLHDAIPSTGIRSTALSADFVLAGQQQPLVDAGVLTRLCRAPAGTRAVAHPNGTLHSY